MKRILCAWLPNWPIQRLVVERPELSRQRVILYQQHAQRGQLVSAASSRALATGVRLEMPLSEAASLCERVGARTKPGASGTGGGGTAVPPLHFFEHEPFQDDQALKELALSCERFSPLIGIDSASQPDCLYLEVTGLTHLFHGEATLACELRDHFGQMGYHVAIALAPTITMAWGTARFASQLSEDFESIEWKGDSAGEEQTPKIRYLSSRQQLQLSQNDFSRLPIEALKLAPSTVEILEQLGVQEIRQIHQLPRAGLRSRFGDEIVQALDRADGVCSEVMVAVRRPAEYSEEIFLDYPLRDQETIEVILSRLIGQLCEQMRSQQRGSLVWHFHLSGPGNSVLRFQVNLFQPAATPEHVMQLVKMQLEQNQSYLGLGKKQRRKVRDKGAKHKAETLADFCFQSFEVSIPNTVLLKQRQASLFDADTQPSRRSLSHLVNTLSSRLGAESVLQARLQAGASAERASRFEPLVGSRSPDSLSPIPKGRNPNRPPALSPLERPINLFVEPSRLNPLYDLIDSQKNGRRSRKLPPAFDWKQKRLHVHRSWGPERVETRWWNAPTTRRDYWRIETNQGRWLWIFFDLRERHWYVHGEM